MNKDTFNDRMVKKTVIPAIYLWLLASGAVVGMGILYPDVVLANLDGFIALIAIIGGVAAPALHTVLRMWESEQQIEIDDLNTQQQHRRERHTAQHVHQMELASKEQIHQQAVEKHGVGMTVLNPIVSRTEDDDWDA